MNTEEEKKITDQTEKTEPQSQVEPEKANQNPAEDAKLLEFLKKCEVAAQNEEDAPDGLLEQIIQWRKELEK